MYSSATWVPQAPDDSDTALVERLRVGDAAAFEELLRRHYSMVYRVVHGVVGNTETATDLAQDTFALLYRQPPRLDGATVLGAWLYRAAIHRAFNALRAAQGSRADTAVQREDRARVRAALARLPRRMATGLLSRATRPGQDAGGAP